MGHRRPWIATWQRSCAYFEGHGLTVITATCRRQDLYRHDKPRAGNDMQHAMASLRHFACKEMPQSIAATPIAIRLAPTRCLDIRAPFRKWHKPARLDLDAQRARKPRKKLGQFLPKMGRKGGRFSPVLPHKRLTDAKKGRFGHPDIYAQIESQDNRHGYPQENDAHVWNAKTQES
jgi:hypothetical protein